MCCARARRCGATAAAASRPRSRDAELASAVTRRAERLRIVVIWPPRAPPRRRRERANRAGRGHAGGRRCFGNGRGERRGG